MFFDSYNWKTYKTCLFGRYINQMKAFAHNDMSFNDIFWQDDYMLVVIWA